MQRRGEYEDMKIANIINFLYGGYLLWLHVDGAEEWLRNGVQSSHLVTAFL